MRPLLLAALALTACANPQPPAVQASPMHDTRDALGPYAISALVVENRELSAVRLFHRAATATQSGVVELQEVLPGRWEGAIPGYPAGTTVHWLVEAEDGDGNLGYDPPEAEYGDLACLQDLDPGEDPPEGGASFCFAVLH